MAKTDAERQSEKRARDKALGIEVVRVEMSKSQRDQLTELCKVRGGLDPYDANEFINTLIRRNYELLEKQLANIGDCKHCGKALPEGCKGYRLGDSRCWINTESKKLQL